LSHKIYAYAKLTRFKPQALKRAAREANRAAEEAAKAAIEVAKGAGEADQMMRVVRETSIPMVHSAVEHMDQVADEIQLMVANANGVADDVRLAVSIMTLAIVLLTVTHIFFLFRRR
jgi:CHASE3 domain sensor protein